MEVVDPREFILNGAFREADFRAIVEKFNWKQYEGKPVLIQGCNSVPLPTWAYLVLTANVAPVAKSISYGELSRPIPVSGTLGVPAEGK